MLVKGLEQRISALKTQKIELEKEISNLLKNRDIVFSEIKDQRSWKSIVVTESRNEQTKLDYLTNLVFSLWRQLKENTFNYSKTTVKQTEVINKFENNIEELTKKINILKNEEDIFGDTTARLKELEKKHIKRRWELAKLDEEIKKKEINIKRKITNIKKKEIKIKEIEALNDNFNRQLILKEKKLNKKEKKLNKLLSKK